MKHVIEIGIVGCLLMAAGCTSPGGAYIVGPFSAMSAKHIDKAKMTRSVAINARIAAEKKEPIIRAVNMAMSPGEIAVGYQVDVLSLFSSDYTFSELALQTAGATIDLAGEAAAGIALYNTITKDSHDTKTAVVIYNNGSGNINTINQGSGTLDRSNIATDGAANGDLAVGK